MKNGFSHKKLQRQNMFVTHLPRLQSHHFPIFFNSPLCKFFVFKSPKHQLLVSSALLSEPFSTALSSKPSQINPPVLQESRKTPENNEPQIQLSIEKLFVPPDTDVSSLKTPLSTRVLKGSNIILSKYATDSQVENAEFVKSSVKTEDCPSGGFPEFALVGRSNVGKSSLLNSIVRRKKLALTSKKPGKCFCFTEEMWSVHCWLDRCDIFYFLWMVFGGMPIILLTGVD